MAPFANFSFNIVMTLCGGIVTNFGGTLLHAGIVSRGLGIPCATDCSFATSLVVDGSMVEVDGNTGTVGILSLPQ